MDETTDAGIEQSRVQTGFATSFRQMLRNREITNISCFKQLNLVVGEITCYAATNNENTVKLIKLRFQGPSCTELLQSPGGGG